MLEQIFTTVVKRPYVFIFLISFLFLGFRRFGWRRTLFWLISCYTVAWLSEYSSIHNGFPYGLYKYRYDNLAGEMLIAGVPWFDSLSYPFLIFAGFSLFEEIKKSKGSILILTLGGGLLTMLLDVIIDPVATMGDRWFLGSIHYYVYPGFYFGVPLTNFAGWFLTAAVAILVNLVAWKHLPFLKTTDRRQTTFDKICIPLFYSGIALFMISISAYLKEYLLMASSLIILTTILGIYFKNRSLDETTSKSQMHDECC
ncbi:MAG: carotenoid biosynthesis protein [Pseudomonadota bacterium]